MEAVQRFLAGGMAERGDVVVAETEGRAVPRNSELFLSTPNSMLGEERRRDGGPHWMSQTLCKLVPARPPLCAFTVPSVSPAVAQNQGLHKVLLCVSSPSLPLNLRHSSPQPPSIEHHNHKQHPTSRKTNLKSVKMVKAGKLDTLYTRTHTPFSSPSAEQRRWDGGVTQSNHPICAGLSGFLHDSC